MKNFSNKLKLEYLRYKNFKNRVRGVTLSGKQSWFVSFIPLIIIIIVFFIPFSFIFSAGIYDLLNGGKLYIYLFIITIFASNFLYNKVRYEILLEIDKELESNNNLMFAIMLDSLKDTVIYSLGALLCLYVGGQFL